MAENDAIWPGKPGDHAERFAAGNTVQPVRCVNNYPHHKYSELKRQAKRGTAPITPRVYPNPKKMIGNGLKLFGSYRRAKKSRHDHCVNSIDLIPVLLFP